MQQPCMLEVLDAPNAADGAKGASILARLAEREEQRAACNAKRLEDTHTSADPRESVEAFLQDFAAKQRALDAALQRLAAAPEDGGAAELAALTAQLATLEKEVSDAAYFLPAFDLRQATLALGVLRELHEAAAAALQPRKRFAFSRKAPKAGTAAEASQQAPLAEPSSAGSSGAAVAQPAASQPAAGGQQQPRVQDTQQPALGAQQECAAGARAAGGGSAISGLRGRVVALGREEAAGKELTLADLEDCSVYLLAPLAALFLHRLCRCRVYTGPVAGACFVEGAEDSVLMIAARQVRIHAAHRADFYLRVASHPIIEHSDGVRVAPYAPAYPGAQADLDERGLGRDDAALWRQVDDFGWLRATPSPHWAELPAAERLAPPAAPPGQPSANGAT